MSHIDRRIAITLVPLLTLFAPGCASMQDVIAGLDKPAARVTGASLQDLSLQGVGVLFDVEIRNPYSVPLPLLNLEYDLATEAGKPFIAGVAEMSGTVPAGGRRTVQLPANITFARLLETADDLKPGDVVSYDANLTMAVDAPGIGRMALPMRKTGKVPVPAVPNIELATITWDKLALAEASGAIQVKMVNTNSFTLGLNAMDYDLKLGGVSIGSSTLKKGVRMTKGDIATIEIPISIKPINLGLGVLGMLQGSGAAYDFKGTLDADTPFGPIRMPYHSQGNAPFNRK